MNRTVKIRLPNEQVLIDTCEEYSKVAKEIVNVGWDITDNRFELHHIVYNPVRKTSKLSAQLVVSCISKACEVLRRAKSRPRFRKLVTVRYDARSYWVKLKEGICSLTTLAGRRKYSFTLPDYYAKYLDWEVRSAELCRDFKGRLWLNVCVAKEVEANTCSTSAVHNIGVDLGINNLAVTSDAKFFKGVTNTLDKMQRLRSSLQSKGTKSAKRHLKKIRRRQRFYMRDVDHRVTKQIVEGLSAGSTIVLEDLRCIKKQRRGRKLNRLLSNWSCYQFHEFLTYKAEERNICVAFVKAKNTSKTCSACGSLNSERPHRSGFFHCKDCGFSLNADLNGARNILARLDPLGNGFRAVVNQPIVASCV